MTPPEFSLTEALARAVWMLNNAGMIFMIAAGVPVASTILLWIVQTIRTRIISEY